MARYDFRCRTCGSTFEVERPMAESSDPADCPEGHDDTIKLMPVFAKLGASTGSDAPPGGGCCGGGGCACHN